METGDGGAGFNDSSEASEPPTADRRPSAVTHRDPSWEELLSDASTLGPDARFQELTDAEVVADLASWAARIDAATCVFLELLAELVVRGVWADEGARTPASWLSWRVGIAPSTAREQVRVALALRRFPTVRDRFAAGTLSYSKVRAITRCGVPEAEELLLAWADDATAGRLEQVARGFRSAERARHDPDAGGPERCAVAGRDLGGGRRSLTISGPAETIVQLEDDIRQLAEALVADRTAPSGTEAPAADDGARPLDGPFIPERAVHVSGTDQVDALVGVVATAAAGQATSDSSGLDRHTLVLDASVDDLAEDGPPVVGAQDAHGRIRGMDRRTLRRLACQTGIVIVARDRDGSPLDVGRRRRTPTSSLRRAVHRRDRCCTFPGCGATRYLHVHHVLHWADGGPTDLDNLVLVCAFHHRFVHAQDWRIEVRRDGRHRYRRPDRTTPVPGVGRSSGVSAAEVADRAPRTASAEALLPTTYDGTPYHLDTAVAVLQRLHRPADDPYGEVELAA